MPQKPDSEFYTQAQKFTKGELNDSFIDACEHGDLDKVKFLLNSHQLRKHANIQCENNSGLHEAAKKGHLHIVQYLLTSPELKEHANIYSRDNWVLTVACNGGHLELVKYLLTSPNLKNHSKFHSEQLQFAIYVSHFHIVDYLLNSPDLKEKFNIHMDRDTIFKQACEFGDMKTLRYLITELNINKNDEINNYLNQSFGRDGNLRTEAKKMFETKEITEQLNEELDKPKNDTKNKKNKKSKI